MEKSDKKSANEEDSFNKKLDAFYSIVRNLNNSFLPVFSSLESDFQENEKVSNQLWPRSRLPLSAMKILSDEEENLRGKPRNNSISKATIDSKISDTEERAPQIHFESTLSQPSLKKSNVSSVQNSGALLRGETFEDESNEKGI